MKRLIRIGKGVRSAVREFQKDDCMTMAAALAFYAIFSLPPLVLIVMTVAGQIWGAESVQGQMDIELDRLFGAIGKQQILRLMELVQHRQIGPLGIYGNYAILIFGATALVMQIQASLNRVWNRADVQPRMMFLQYLLKWLFSFVLILAGALLLLLTLVLTMTASMVTQVAKDVTPGAATTLDFLSQFAIGLLLLILILAALFRWLPDDPARWRDIWAGSCFTALLLAVGKEVMGRVLATMVPANGGTTGSMILLLLWIYYSSIILLFGAELTQVWAGRSRQPLK